MSSVKKEMIQLLANYGHIGFTFVGCIFIGLGGGIALDQKVFDGRTSPWFTFIGLAFGIAAGFKTMIDILWKARDKGDKKTTIEDDVVEDLVSLQKMQVVAWLYLLVLSLGGGIILSWTFAMSVFAGGVISIISFIVSFRDVVGFFDSLSPAQDEEQEKEQVKKSKTGFLLKFWFRIGIIGVVLLLLIKSGRINIFGLILGLTTVVFTVTIMALSVAKRYFFSGRR